MKNFFNNNIVPILLSALLAMFGYMTHAVITNQAHIKALSDDIDEVKTTLSDMLKVMIDDSNKSKE
jgi:chitodextrinase